MKRVKVKFLEGPLAGQVHEIYEEEAKSQGKKVELVKEEKAEAKTKEEKVVKKTKAQTITSKSLK